MITLGIVRITLVTAIGIFDAVPQPLVSALQSADPELPAVDRNGLISAGWQTEDELADALNCD